MFDCCFDACLISGLCLDFELFVLFIIGVCLFAGYLCLGIAILRLFGWIIVLFCFRGWLGLVWLFVWFWLGCDCGVCLFIYCFCVLFDFGLVD